MKHPMIEQLENTASKLTGVKVALDGIEAALQMAVDRIETPSILVDYDEAARLLDTTVGALRMRVQRGLVPGVVRTGRRVQFRRDLLGTIGTRKRK